MKKVVRKRVAEISKIKVDPLITNPRLIVAGRSK